MDSVLVMMSTYNGEKYLAAQLDSLLKQINVDCHIIIRDDGSCDDTQNILERYSTEHSNIKWFQGNNLGAAKSFWELLSISSGADCFAFCDQDDIWMPEKLYMAISKLKKWGTSKPTLYYSKQTMVDKMGNEIKTKEYTYQSCKPTFSQLIVENNAAGCTMVWNNVLQDIAKKVNPQHMRMHDHLLYLICSACDGYIYYDKNSYMMYRQHENNVIGGKNTLLKYVKSIKKYISKDSEIALQSIDLLQLEESYINQKKRKVIYNFKRYKESDSIRDRLKFALKTDYNQKSILKNIMIKGMILLHRL